MRECFELQAVDGAGRIGELTIPRADVTVETPALLPVINPNIDTVAPADLESEFGAEILITNAYIIHGNEGLREQALQEGLHELLDFSGAIMTDSGAFQLSEYGEIDVTTEEILQFQREIGSDVGTPVDLPTPPDVAREEAERQLETTLDRLQIADDAATGEMLVTAPVQGSTYPDLRERAARKAYATGLDVFPVGAVVPLLGDYRFADVVDVVAAAKRGLGEDAPVHLFGAGHPMMFALAAAAGCDLFDSAAYALYARDDRYMTVRGTEYLDDLEYLPCDCAVCTEYDADGLRDLPGGERERRLAEHNLSVSFAEIRRVRQAIRRGNLLELVETRARSHPALLAGYRALLEHAEWLAASDPIVKDTFFYTSTESADRPEVQRYHDRLERLDLAGVDTLLVTEADPGGGYDESWDLRPPFGPVPPALSRVYPLTAETPERPDRRARERAVDAIARLHACTSDVEITVGHRGWPDDVIADLPPSVEAVDVTAGDQGTGRSERQD
ncbi:7-cyano-7-deazaguanine tRNA-ribosyltransferase [Salinarchaeum sp. Harcht-Bsk1]|uniref:tRNA guanosine(15) transglycosylase TgtA n=1 Tax=Salinarchaeum sp. Harcht-Bsk1 TaxID=1333523 RepID=UPI0003422E2D|nr:tRNA guanosine(15) transglycosylase TgtA [Salinarchaeum sp. Harcht-Bsk1]AGN01722.1 7-cyano-7-deazaguanine tRNA-ribosyltransferase [Salinarchaeum sp. Harcht-Bsk1]